jgi:hypothetical protein
MSEFELATLSLIITRHNGKATVTAMESGKKNQGLYRVGPPDEDICQCPRSEVFMPNARQLFAITYPSHSSKYCLTIEAGLVELLLESLMESSSD